MLTVESVPRMRREWAMPSPFTFSIAPISALLGRWLRDRTSIVDPCCGKSEWAHWANDLSPEMGGVHLDAVEFLRSLYDDNITADALLIDPPYSPRQVMESYKGIGRKVGQEDTQTARLYGDIKDEASRIAGPGCVAICCGWNSSGMGKGRGWELREVLIVAHGGAHNDTIVTVETKTATLFDAEAP